MCLIPRYGFTFRPRTDGTVAGCSKSKPLQCCHLAAATAPLPSVCLSVTDAGGRTADGWLINAGPLQFRAAADG